MSCVQQHGMGRRAGATFAGGVALLAVAAIAPVSAHAGVCIETMVGPDSGVLNVAADKKLRLVGAAQTGAANFSLRWAACR